MATNQGSLTDVTEFCETCGRRTPHHVRLELVTESTNPENAQFSREPYRVSECKLCDQSVSIRMNNA